MVMQSQGIYQIVCLPCNLVASSAVSAASMNGQCDPQQPLAVILDATAQHEACDVEMYIPGSCFHGKQAEQMAQSHCV